MLLTRQAFELLVTPHGPMKCRLPDFPEIIFAFSDCGTYKYFKSEKFFIVVIFATSTRKAVQIVGFYQSTFSNFSQTHVVYNINGKDVIFECGEQAFKGACAIAHLQSKDASHDVIENNLKVLKAILDAPEPKKAKKAAYDIKEFDRAMWDNVSPEVMYWVQLLKFKDVNFRNFGLELAKIAKDEGVEPENIFFAETAGSDDSIWGTGPGANTDELFELIRKEGNTEKLYNNLVDPKKRREPGDVIFVGFNGLGKAIERALRDLIGENFQGLSESMEEFVKRIDDVGGFDFFEFEAMEPEAKRSRSASSEPAGDTEQTVQRHLSVEPGEVCDEESGSAACVDACARTLSSSI